MESFVVAIRLSILSLILGIAFLVYYLRTRKRWAWVVAVVFMTVGGFGLSLWLG